MEPMIVEHYMLGNETGHTAGQASNQCQLWDELATDGYKRGWSSRWDSRTPSLISDACVWYFEGEMDEVDATSTINFDMSTRIATSVIVSIH